MLPLLVLAAAPLSGAAAPSPGRDALMPVLEGAIPTEAVRDFNQVLVNMQLAYASAAEEGTTKDE